MKVNVVVMPKEAVLDPQGAAVRDAMKHLGMPEVRSVRIGKYMEIEVEGANPGLEERLHNLCRDLLSNPVIEDYELQKVNAGSRSDRGPERNESVAILFLCRLSAGGRLADREARELSSQPGATQCLGGFPGMIHACLVVIDYHEEQRAARLARAR